MRYAIQFLVTFYNKLKHGLPSVLCTNCQLLSTVAFICQCISVGAQLGPDTKPHQIILKFLHKNIDAVQHLRVSFLFQLYVHIALYPVPCYIHRPTRAPYTHIYTTNVKHLFLVLAVVSRINERVMISVLLYGFIRLLTTNLNCSSRILSLQFHLLSHFDTVYMSFSVCLHSIRNSTSIKFSIRRKLLHFLVVFMCVCMYVLCTMFIIYSIYVFSLITVIFGFYIL